MIGNVRSDAQKKRVGQKRLDNSLGKVVSHPAWEAGLGIASHLGALKPELVDDEIDVEEAVKQLESCFGYQDEKVPNPQEGNPALFQSCNHKFPGVCISSKHWGSTMKLVQQLEIGLENFGRSAGTTILHFKAGGRSAAAESAKQPALPAPSHSSWYMLGCGSKRPLCHILGSLQWLRKDDLKQPVLVPCYSEININAEEKKYWTLRTSHEARRNFS